MDSPGELPSRSSAAISNGGKRAFISRTFIFNRRGPGQVSSDDNDEPPISSKVKGPLGLTTLHTPGPDTPAVADIVFVHGLNGGSQSTWCKGNRQSNFWPREWLPADPAFQDTRIHSFGYPSAISRESILNVTDFARSLLAAVNDSPAINSGSTRPPLVFVAHSMGGLVVKKAYILSHQDAEFKSIAERVCCIIFLATPHQGAAIAQSLARLATIVGARPFVDDLLPHSPAIQSINEEFPRICDKIQLMSFYETRPMNVGFSRIHIVEKASAVMNLSNERRTLLDADHRNVAMYSSPNESAFVSVRNALVTVISSQRDSSLSIKRVAEQKDLAALNEFLSLSYAPEEDIMTQDDARLPGSCQWLISKDYYQSWRQGMDSRFLWIRGRPGAGKSVLAGHVVNDLRDRGLDCSFFFFQAGDEARSSVNSFLRSMAWQMAIHHPSILTKMKESMADGPVDKIDPNPVWRNVYLSGALKVRLDKPQFWVIDALDECKGSADTMRFIARIQEQWPVSVLVTSRDSLEEHHLNNLPTPIDIQSHAISDQDSLQDITLLLKANVEHLPLLESDKWPSRWAIASKIIEKSEGCFLWASLICSELRHVTSEKEIDKVMDSTPSNMDAVYSEILADMGSARFGKETAKAFITWTTYAFRPLSTTEIQRPIEMDINDKIADVERTISKCCGSLVFVDKHKKVQLVHSTAREFLTRKGTTSEFTVTKAEGHHRLAAVCLNYLIDLYETKYPGKAHRLGSDTEVRNARTSRRKSPTPSVTSAQQAETAPFIDYASKFLFQHIANVSSTDNEILVLLSDFLGGSSLLHWIEYIATQGDLRTLYSAGKIINGVLNRRSKHSPPVGLARRQDKLALLDRWGDDLIHLASKFSCQLKHCPASIHHLIPPFCPLNSAIRRQFYNQYRGLSVQGLSAREWDDCLTTITYPTGTKPNAVAAGPGYVAVGMMAPQGLVTVYDDSIFQEVHTLEHGEPVWRLAFSGSGSLVASAGAKTVRIWSSTKGTKQATFRIPSLCLSLSFGDGDAFLRVATQQNQLIEWDVEAAMFLKEPVSWATDLKEAMQFRTPMLACIGPAVDLVAVLYRGEDIFLWDCMDDCIYDFYEKDTGSVQMYGSHKLAEGSTTVRAATFSSGLGTYLLAATYADGDLVVYDTERGEPTAKVVGANTMVLASSHDGRTLAGVDSSGNVTLFEFETLRPLFRVCFDTPISPKCLAFTANSLRFIEIRGDQCRVWEPTVLLRSDTAADDDNSDTVSVSIGLPGIDYKSVEKTAPNITAIACCRDASVIFCGMEDGAVHVYDIAGQEPQCHPLFVQNVGCPIHLVHLDEASSVLACGDQWGRVTARNVNRRSSPRQRNAWQTDQVPLIDTRVVSTASRALKQVLVSAKQGRLLVSTEKQDILWPMPKQGEGDYITQTEIQNHHVTGPRWMAHPNGELLLSFRDLGDATRAIQLYSWSNLALVRSVPLAANVIIDRLAPPLWNQQLFATHGSSRGDRSDTSVQLWDLKAVADDDLNDDATLTPIAPQQLDTLPSQIESVIGTFETRLVLYTSDHWVASVELSSSSAPSSATSLPLFRNQAGPGRPNSVTGSSFVRHFFLPQDLIGSIAGGGGRGQKQLISGIGRAGEILLAKRSELAVVKRGLEITENGASFNPKGGSSSGGSRLPSRHRGSSSTSSLGGA